MSSAKWDQYSNFSKIEFDCQRTGENNMQHDFMMKLQALRTEFGKPLIITSGFRSVKHSIEAKKNKAGAHTTGLAVDLGVNRKDAYEVLKLAFELGFTGIGVNQKGNARFIHLDISQGDFMRPTIWSY